jgi:putative FmdB family regulatory protein
MPIYEYQCDDCGTRHEKIVMAHGQKIICPKCASGKQTMQLSVFSTSTKHGSNGGASAGESGAGCGCTPRTCGCN